MSKLSHSNEETMNALALKKVFEEGNEDMLPEDVREPIYRLVSERIKSFRKTLGWSQEKLAQKMGMSRPTIANIEAGRQGISLPNIERFSLAFGVSVQFFMTDIWFINWNKED